MAESIIPSEVGHLFSVPSQNLTFELRPDVVEVVMRVGEAAASWVGLMPPCPRASDVAPDPEESELGSEGPSEFTILILP